jgi:hypothetical protein
MAAVREDVSVSQWDSDQPCQVLTQLFPGGLEDPDHLRELAPEGWERSPLRLVFHPTLEQAYAEAVALHTNIQELRQPGAQPTAAAAPSFEQIRQEYRDEPLRPREEYADLIGYCLWDIFSDGHDVWTAEGVQVDLGSFRGAAGLIAEFRQFASAAKDEFRRGWDTTHPRPSAGSRSDAAAERPPPNCRRSWTTPIGNRSRRPGRTRRPGRSRHIGTSMGAGQMAGPRRKRPGSEGSDNHRRSGRGTVITVFLAGDSAFGWAQNPTTESLARRTYRLRRLTCPLDGCPFLGTYLGRQTRCPQRPLLGIHPLAS